MGKIKISKFLEGIVALMFSSVFIKLLGMVYSLYLTNKKGFGDIGNSLYISSFQIYAIFLTISSIGIPNAVSKLVAESLAVGDINGAKRIFRVSSAIFSLIGFVCSLILYVSADFIGNKILENEASTDILKILAPSIFFVSISSVIRGYFNGKQNIKISAFMQGFEQLVKTILTIIMVEIVATKTNYNTEIMAETAMIAASVATIFSFIYIFIKYIQDRKKLGFSMSTSKFKQTAKSIFKKILMYAIPISAVSFIGILGKNIDSITILKILKNKVGEEIAREKYGILSSKVESFINLPMAINGSVAIALVPEISKLSTINDEKELSKKISFSFFISLCISIPIMVILLLFSNEIINLLYPNANQGGELLRLASLGIVFETLTQTIIGILQGIGDVNSYLKIMSITTILKLILNVILISNDNLLEKGAIISSLICDSIVFIFVLVRMKKKINFKLNLKFNFGVNPLKINKNQKNVKKT